MNISNNYFFQAYILPNSVAARWIAQNAAKLWMRTSASVPTRCFSNDDDDKGRFYESPSDSTISHGSSLSSARGRASVGLLPSYLADARSVSRYAPITNPTGALQLGVAESKMLEDWLLPVLNSHPSIPVDAIYYQPTSGRDDFKSSLATYIEDLCDLDRGRLRREGLIIGAGCNAVLENLCMTLADVGEGVLIPTPYYAAFEFDLVARAGLQVHPVTTEAYHTSRPSDDRIDPELYYPNVAALDAAYEKSTVKGCQPRILLISHPMNPLGICYPAQTILDCMDWCRERKIHFICDEIYAGSVYRTDDDDQTKPFQSALCLAGKELGPYVHWVYALSKDFALSGLRIGAAYTENPEILLPMQKLNDLCQISSQTQLWTADLLQRKMEETNELWTTAFRRENHKRLMQRYVALSAVLDRYKIPFLTAQAGLFVWVDLSQFLVLNVPPAAQERTLYLELIEFGLLLTPGLSMRHERPGFFRCVFTAASEDEFALALQRFQHYFDTKHNAK
jgi:1-aminocyclopropane-1-carboxylate synthase